MSLVEFEKQRVVKDFMDICDVHHTKLGGYRYNKDSSPCYQLNDMLIMFEEQQKKIDLLEKELTETQAFLNKQNHIKQTKIDEALKLVQKDCIEYGVSDFLEKAMDILKGNKDETGLN